MYEDLKRQFLTTPRLTTAYYRTGEGNEKKLLLVHGNVSSSAVYLPFMEELGKVYDTVALDLRCFGESSALPVDAEKGYGEWVEDIKEFKAALGWDKFAIAGWSMGGGVVQQYILDHPQELTGAVLINPASPYGFGGTKDEDGKLLEPAGLAAGAGCVNQGLVAALADPESKQLFYDTLHGAYLSSGRTLDPEYEELLVDEMKKTKLGEGMYPGDASQCGKWPFVVAGSKGICNTMAPQYADMSGIINVQPKPPVLWMIGDKDIMVSDKSFAEFGTLGMTGAVPGWPGMDEVPPQPMVSQTRYVLKKYAENGGSYKEVTMDGGHACYLEHPDEFIKIIEDFIG